jgi:8-oxo-dGTP pyrophosphatase MutT (NUDIX family)
MKGEKIIRLKSKWRGKKYNTDVYKYDGDISDLSPITQVAAVCFLNTDKVVFYKNVEGYLGNPGGGIEDGENYEETLERELKEEAQLKLLDYRFFGYEYIMNLSQPEKNAYFLRAVAKVELIDANINDPCDKSVGRVVVDREKAPETLNWGPKGEVLLKLAGEKYDEVWG